MRHKSADRTTTGAEVDGDRGEDRTEKAAGEEEAGVRGEGHNQDQAEGEAAEEAAHEVRATCS